jgi:hypothetical protein
LLEDNPNLKEILNGKLSCVFDLSINHAAFELFQGKIHEICEKHLFLKHFMQLNNDIDQFCLLNHLFYYSRKPYNIRHRFL